MMIEDDLHIAQLRKIVSNLYIARIESEYGEFAVDITELLTDNLTNIYSYLDLRKFDNIVVVKSLTPEPLTTGGTVYNSVEQFSQANGKELFVELLDDEKYAVQFCITTDLKELSEKAIIYQKEGLFEYFYVKKNRDQLSRLSSLETYFVKPTFKELDQAIAKYKVNEASTSSCITLREKLWSDDNRIVFVAGPEEVMRDSLHQFLKSYLRGNKEVLREQNVNESRPIDIRITWNYTNHVALIEIKWIGLSSSGTGYEGQTAITRSNKGAKQLAEYLDLFDTESPAKSARGYLVVFDGRRKEVTTATKTINRFNGMFYENLEIEYNPKYDEERFDFETPARLFLKPKCN